MKRHLIAAVGLLALVASACTTSDTGFGGEPPDGEARLVLRMEYQGGLVPVDYEFTRQPSLVIMSDGRLYTTPAMIEIYPPPVSTSWEVRSVTPAAIDAIRQRAKDAGLEQGGSHDPDADGGPQIADAATTVFVYVDENGNRHEASAYALGELGDETGTRQQLTDLRNDLGDLERWLPAGSVVDAGSIEPAPAIRIGVSAYGSTGDDGLGPRPIDGGDDFRQEPRTWPLDEPLASFGVAYKSGVAERCGILTGGDLDRFLAATEGANTLTPWESDGAEYLLLLDPLTPDEPGTCS